MKTKTIQPTDADRKVRDAMLAVMRKEGADLPADRILAIAAYTVGQLIALQDQRTMTPAMAMDIVARNIELGNGDAVNDLLDTKGEA